MKFSAIFAILTLASAAAAAPAEASIHQDANNIIIRNDVNDGPYDENNKAYNGV
ncbi:hypothetical protein ACKVWC_008307 [Pyricularia oryzae]